MSPRSKCIFITGVGHSGTRLLVQMLSRHPDVWVPTPYEFAPMHHFFIHSIDITPLYSHDYIINRSELRFIMDAYMQIVDHTKLYFLVKMPLYPLYCLDFYLDYFEGNVSFLYTQRPVDKVIRSYLNRGQDLTLFLDNRIRNVKKLGVDKRKHFLATDDATLYFRELISRCDSLRVEWDRNHPEQSFIEVDIEGVATSRDRLIELLQQLDLSTSVVDDMLAVVDVERLLNHRERIQGRKKISLKRFAWSLTPPLLWSVGRKLVNKR